MNPLCSCTECDSVSCFAKRQTDAPCSCRTCSNSKSCLFYNRRTNISESKSGLLNYNDTEIAAENITRELVKKEMIYEFDKNKTTITKKQSRYSYKTEKGSKDRIEKESKNLCTQRATNSPKEKEESSPTARLSAQIMDVPCNDFENSILKLNNRSKMSPFNIFNRIKEAYKACSCKVCECIVGKSMQNDHCSCKLCECNDCGNFNRHVESFKYSGRLDPKDDKDCPCNKCDRVSCKGIGKDKNEGLNYCDCLDWLSSDYLKDDNSLTKDCKCEPCQCMVCKPRLIHSHKTFIVAPVGQEQQSSVCQCSPCECFECRRTFGLTSNLHREMSTTTSMTRYPHCHCEMCSNDACLLDSNQSCRCQRFSKIMSKPVQQDSHDYDIRRATVTYDDSKRHRDK